MQRNLWWMSVCIVLLIAAGPLLALLLQLFYRFGGDFVPCVDSLREGLFLFAPAHIVLLLIFLARGTKLIRVLSSILFVVTYIYVARTYSNQYLQRFSGCAAFGITHLPPVLLSNCTFGDRRTWDIPLHFMDSNVTGDALLDNAPTGTLVFRRAWKPPLKRIIWPASIGRYIFGLTQDVVDGILFLNHVGVIINPRDFWHVTATRTRFLSTLAPSEIEVKPSPHYRGSWVVHHRLRGITFEPLFFFLDKQDMLEVQHSRWVPSIVEGRVWIQLPVHYANHRKIFQDNYRHRYDDPEVLDSNICKLTTFLLLLMLIGIWAALNTVNSFIIASTWQAT